MGAQGQHRHGAGSASGMPTVQRAHGWRNYGANASLMLHLPVEKKDAAPKSCRKRKALDFVEHQLCQCRADETGRRAPDRPRIRGRASEDGGGQAGEHVPDAHEDDGHHAERRIDEHFAQKHQDLALYAKPHDITPTTVGAAWFGKNAWQGTVAETDLADIGKIKALAKQIHVAVLAADGTSITLCRDHKAPSGKPWDHGSDSESENEFEASEAKPTEEKNDSAAA
ncbi:hypothetical protein ACFUAC_29195 [Streptomyces sp. NPDC057148]|uniref:hypothetical protein n=1 Tax=unclassified Streptomyces TaxID=2593676 RepID=UPI00362B6849